MIRTISPDRPQLTGPADRPKLTGPSWLVPAADWPPGRTGARRFYLYFTI
jgi:hypothetical protein